jgi:hypothetical protein
MSVRRLYVCTSASAFFGAREFSILGGTTYDTYSTVLLDTAIGNRYVKGATSVAQLTGSFSPEIGQQSNGWIVTRNSVIAEQVGASVNSHDFNNGMALRGDSGNYSGTTWELDSSTSHLNWPSTSAPTGADVSSAIGTSGNGASVSVSGNDRRGQVTVVTASTGLGGSWPVVVANTTSVNAYGSSPKVIITPVTGLAAGVQAYANGFSTTQFSLGFNVAPAISTTYTFSYMVEG